MDRQIDILIYEEAEKRARTECLEDLIECIGIDQKDKDKFDKALEGLSRKIAFLSYIKSKEQQLIAESSAREKAIDKLGIRR